MRGGHHLKSWASTQKKVTLSSAEAEFAACIKASCETIGMLQLAESLGRKLEAEVHVDSSAALGVIDRKGNGKLRHIRVGQLWVQQIAEDEIVAYRKVHGKENPADLCTKNLTQSQIDSALEKIELRIREGRAQEGLALGQLGCPEEWEICSYDKNKRVKWADAVEEETVALSSG